jgi:hypothetical protein
MGGVKKPERGTLRCSPEILDSTPFYVLLTIPIGRLPPYVVMLFSEGRQRRNSWSYVVREKYRVCNSFVQQMIVLQICSIFFLFHSYKHRKWF